MRAACSGLQAQHADSVFGMKVFSSYCSGTFSGLFPSPIRFGWEMVRKLAGAQQGIWE